MVDKDFMNIKDQVDYLIKLIDISMNNYNRNDFENKHVYYKLEGLQSDLDCISEYIKYMNTVPVEGYLVELDNEKYECPEADMRYSCGSQMEAYIKPYEDEEPMWCIGRVEHDTDKGYYFLNYEGDNVVLYEGMKVRVR